MSNSSSDTELDGLAVAAVGAALAGVLESLDAGAVLLAAILLDEEVDDVDDVTAGFVSKGALASADTLVSSFGGLGVTAAWTATIRREEHRQNVVEVSCGQKVNLGVIGSFESAPSSLVDTMEAEAV